MTTPFKALFISNDPSIFDESSSTRARMREYAQAIDELHILSRCGSYAGPVSVDDGPLHLHAVRGPRFWAMWTMPAQAKSLISTYGIDIVSAQDPFEYGMIAYRAVQGTRAKLHIQVHTDFLSKWFTLRGITRSPRTRGSSINAVRQQLADRVLPHADGIRVVSKRINDSMVVRYGTKIPTPSIIPIQIPAELPSKVDLPPHPFTFVFMTIGRLEPEKRIEDILVALSKIKDKYPKLGLMIVGDGRERKNLERWVHGLELQSRVMFLGNRSEAVGLLQSANAYIQASAYEGYGRTLLEAALARVPIITTDVGIMGEVFKGYEDVLATPPGDPMNLMYHMVGILEDLPVRQQLVRNAEEAARKHLASMHAGPDAIAEDLLKTLQHTS